MKPTKNRVFCNHCHRPKMLFTTQEKADNFIKFNAEAIAENNRRYPIRSYFCPACGGWHVTHKEESEEYRRTDEQNEKIFKLGVFVNHLKQNFNEKDWRQWRESIATYRQWIAELENMVEYRFFLMDAKKQFNHFEKMAANGEKKEQKLKNIQQNDVQAKRKKLCKSIYQKMKELDLESCKEQAERLYALMQLPAFDGSEEKIKDECKNLTDFFVEEDNYTKLQSIVQTLQTLKGRMNYIPTNDLELEINSMTDNYDDLALRLNNKKILSALTNRIQKCRNYLQGRLTGKINKQQTDNALHQLEVHLETIRQYLIEAVTALQENNNDLAVLRLTMADNRLKTIPFSQRKIEMLTYLLSIAEKTTLDNVF